MRLDSSIKSGFNLVLCHSAALSPISEIRESWSRLLSVNPNPNHNDNSSDQPGNQLHATRNEAVRLIC